MGNLIDQFFGRIMDGRGPHHGPANFGAANLRCLVQRPVEGAGLVELGLVGLGLRRAHRGALLWLRASNALAGNAIDLHDGSFVGRPSRRSYSNTYLQGPSAIGAGNSL